jgi:hypothetical protein
MSSTLSSGLETMTNRADTGRDKKPAETSLREVVAAWVVLALLLLGTGLGFTLDHMVTVSDRPDLSSVAPATGGDAAPDEADGQSRELRDSDGR